MLINANVLVIIFSLKSSTSFHQDPWKYSDNLVCSLPTTEQNPGCSVASKGFWSVQTNSEQFNR